MNSYWKIIIAVFIVLHHFGCASEPKGEFTEGVEIQTSQLPDALKNKFEIKDISDAPASEVAKEEKPSDDSKTKKTANLKKKSEEPKEAKGFQIPNRRPKIEPIWVGEKADYDVTYFGVVAGKFTLEVKPHKYVNDRKVYHIYGQAKSSSVFSFVYSINDSLQSFIDYNGLYSHRFELKLDESKQARDALELFDSEKKESFYWDRWHHHNKGFIEKKEYAVMAPFSQDVISSLYYVRGKELNPGDQFTFPVVSEGKSWEAVINVVRREELKTPLGRLKTIVLRPEMKFHGKLKQQGDSFVWLTDDTRRHLIRVEAKVKIGAVVGMITALEPGSPP